jgi:hypothetical protein
MVPAQKACGVNQLLSYLEIGCGADHLLHDIQVETDPKLSPARPQTDSRRGILRA